MISSESEIRRTSATAPREASVQDCLQALVHGHARMAVLLLFALSPLCMAQVVRYQTSVAPLAYEDIAANCHYELIIPTSTRQLAAVWVIFDRGRDVHDLSTDKRVLGFAHRFRIALLLHGHCPGKTAEDHKDMNMDPSKGLGRALSTALDQLASISGHRELASARLMFLGFSGAGSLSARLVGYFVNRTLAAVLSAPGHYEPLGIDTVELNAQLLAVPELIIAGSADKVSGTARPYLYFKKYRDQGAPWAFVVQNGSPHCCTANARDLILEWLEAVLRRGIVQQGNVSPETDQRVGWHAFFKVQQTETTDSFGLKTFRVTEAKIDKLPSKKSSPGEWESAGWLPNHTVADAWLNFVRQKHHPILPLN